MIRRPPSSPLFPYTPLFRSVILVLLAGGQRLRTVFRLENARVAAGRAWPLCSGEVCGATAISLGTRSEEHTSELQSRLHLVCRLLLEKKKHTPTTHSDTNTN